jgi:hypothetical protein
MPMAWTNCVGCGLRAVAIGGALALLTGCRAQVAPDLGHNPSIAEDPADRDSKAVADSESSAPAVAARSTLDRRARDKDQLRPITFDDLKVNIQADQLFEPWMATDRVRELDGQRVRIRGFFFPAIFQQTGIKSFPLVMNTDCKFGPGEQAHHVILVEMIDGASTSYTVRPIAVTGRLTLAPWTGPDGNTWALYHIAGERVD